MAHYGKGMKAGYKPDDEEKISRAIQSDDRGASVKDRGMALNDYARKSDPNVGSYDGCPNPVAGVEYKGAGMDGELAEYQTMTKDNEWSNPARSRQQKGGKG